MKKVSAFVLFAILSFEADAFSCLEKDPAERYEAAERLFLVRVTETRVEPTGQFDPAILEDGPIHLVSAGYDVVEEFKGDRDDQPRFLQILHFTGMYPNLTPGVYYLVAIEPIEPEEGSEMPWPSEFALITSCEIVTAYLPEALEEDIDGRLNQILNTYRGIRDKL